MEEERVRNGGRERVRNGGKERELEREIVCVRDSVCERERERERWR